MAEPVPSRAASGGLAAARAATRSAAPAPLVCTGCGLLCDDILPGSDEPANACAAGKAAFAAARTPALAAAWDGGAPLERSAAVDRAARVIAAARRVLVTGLADATLESIAVACDCAEAVGAAVDAGAADAARAAGPIAARVGEITADWEELRDRADLVIVWFCDPATTHPRFLERFVTPTTADGRPRRTIAVGPDGVLPTTGSHLHLPLPREAAVAAARALHARLTDPDEPATSFPLALGPLRDAIAAAGCVAVVTGQAADRVGLEPWSVAGVVRVLAHERPAFQIPLGGGAAAGGGNAAGAAAVCTWRYGATGAIERADPFGGAFLPAECDALRLIERGEVDCVVAVGRLDGTLESAIAARGDRLAVVRISDAPSPVPPSGRAATIQVRCASPLVVPAGTMLRGDGRRIVLGGAHEHPDSMVAILAALRDRLRGCLAGGDLA